MSTLQKKSSKFLPRENYFYLVRGRTECETDLFLSGVLLPSTVVLLFLANFFLAIKEIILFRSYSSPKKGIHPRD
jgi:hypothetical protein